MLIVGVSHVFDCRCFMRVVGVVGVCCCLVLMHFLIRCGWLLFVDVRCCCCLLLLVLMLFVD